MGGIRPRGAPRLGGTRAGLICASHCETREEALKGVQDHEGRTQPSDSRRRGAPDPNGTVLSRASGRKVQSLKVERSEL